MIYNFRVKENNAEKIIIAFVMNIGNSEMDCILEVPKDMPIDELLPKEIVEYLNTVM